jgi:hypothetical protein
VSGSEDVKKDVKRVKSNGGSTPKGMDIQKVDAQIIRFKRLLNGEKVGEMGPFQPNDPGFMKMYKQFCARHNVTERYASEVWKRYNSQEVEGMEAKGPLSKNMVKSHGVVYTWDLDALAEFRLETRFYV